MLLHIAGEVANLLEQEPGPFLLLNERRSTRMLAFLLGCTRHAKEKTNQHGTKLRQERAPVSKSHKRSRCQKKSLAVMRTRERGEVDEACAR